MTNIPSNGIPMQQMLDAITRVMITTTPEQRQKAQDEWDRNGKLWEPGKSQG